MQVVLLSDTQGHISECTVLKLNNYNVKEFLFSLRSWYFQQGKVTTPTNWQMVYSALQYTDLTKAFLTFTEYCTFMVNAIHINKRSTDFHKTHKCSTAIMCRYLTSNFIQITL
jgi:hypothetical protein